MKQLAIISFWLIAPVLISSLSACQQGEQERIPTRTAPVTLSVALSDWSPEQAQQRLRQHIAQFPSQANARLTHISRFDVGIWHVFEMLPRAGVVSRIFYIVSPDDIISSAWTEDFNRFMRRLNVGTDPHAIAVEKFATLFIYVRLRTTGSIITSSNDAPVSALRPENMPPEQYTPPEIIPTHEGIRYRFWMWDATQFKSLYLDVFVTPDGTTTYEQLYP